MLVVLAIIAVVASISVLAIGSGSGNDGQAEAKQLQARLQLAADDTMIEDRSLALSIAPTGYAFMEWDGHASEWRPSTVGPLAESHALPRGLTLSETGGRDILPIGASTSGEGFTLVLAGNGRSWTVDFDGMTARTARGAPVALAAGAEPS